MKTDGWKFKRGDMVQKIRGSEWHGMVVGFYTTAATERGYAVESMFEKGSVQIYPEAALELIMLLVYASGLGYGRCAAMQSSFTSSAGIGATTGTRA